MARTGRPTAPLVLTDEERATLIRWARRAKSAQVLAMRSRIILACAEGASNTDVATAGRASVHGRQVAQTVPDTAARRLDRRTAPRPAPVDRPGHDRGGRRGHPRTDTAQRHALVTRVHGAKVRAVKVDDRPDLARLRPQTAPG